MIIQAPLQKYLHFVEATDRTSRLEGTALFLTDLENGLILEFIALETVESSGTLCSCEVRYLAKNPIPGTPPTDAFSPSLSSLKEVKAFSIWDAKQVKKSLAGNPAPEITGVDLNGNPVTLSSLRGKTVLLDFWATWCPPCRADGPSLNKLQDKYGGSDFTVVGIAMGEDRTIVEKYLGEHLAKYPIVLGSEADLPRQFQIQSIPTYVALDANGNLITATSGAQGFGELKKLLKKAGLNLE